MANKNVTIQQKGEQGVLDTLYPKTVAQQVITDEENSFISTQEKNKLSGIENNAQKNIINSIFIDGVQAVPDSNGKVNITLPDVQGFIPTTEKGQAGGVAELDNSGKVPTSQLPSYVDDVVEYGTKSLFPSVGETGKIYVALDTNLTYRWGGSEYVEISPSLALGETSSTACAGDKGKQNSVDIQNLKSDVAGIKNKNSTQDTEIENIKDGTTKVANSSNADKLSTPRNIQLSGDVSGVKSFDGSSNINISTTLSNTGISAGTYSALTVDSKGRATAGGQIIEVGESGQTSPSASLAVGGIFFKVE